VPTPPVRESQWAVAVLAVVNYWDGVSWSLSSQVAGLGGLWMPTSSSELQATSSGHRVGEV
jgi:hypothetical protein